MPAPTATFSPQPSRAHVARPRLDSLAARILQTSVTTISAGAGFGKSELLATWMRELQASARCVWIAVTPSESSLSAFVERLWKGVREALPEIGDSVGGLLERQEVDTRRLADAFANELLAFTADRGERVVIVIDDLHEVGDGRRGAIAFLSHVAAELPADVHLVLASRRPLTFVPLVRMRASGRVLALGESDLRFTVDEAAARFGNVELAHSLVERTGGWAIALLLAAALIAEGRSIEDALPQARDAAFDFLADEVLARFDERVRRHMFVLSIPARIDEPLANHLLERGDAASILDELSAAGISFSRDDRGVWSFHPLFREFLQRRFKIEYPQEMRDVRLRYANVLRERGEKVEALSELIEAGDYLGFVEHVRGAIETILFTDRFPAVLSLLSQVPDVEKRRRPMLYRLQASVLRRSGKWDDAQVVLDRALEAARANGDVSMEFVALIELGIGSDRFYYWGHGDFANSERCFREALSLSHSATLASQPVHERVARAFLGICLARQFKYEEAFEHLAVTERLELAEESHPDLFMYWIAAAYGWVGDWERALELGELSEDLFNRGGTFHIPAARLIQAEALLALGSDASRAFALAKSAVAGFSEQHDFDELPRAHTLLARTALALSPADIEACGDALARAFGSIKRENDGAHFDLQLAIAEQAIFLGFTEEADAALDLAESLPVRSRDRGRSAEAAYWRALVRAADGDGERARERFLQAAATFSALENHHHEQLCLLYAVSLLPGATDANGTSLRSFFDSLSARPNPAIVRVAREAAHRVLVWSLEHGVELDRAEQFLGEAANYDAAPLERIARSSGLKAKSRIAALRLLTAADRRAAFTTIAGLATDRNPDVAATAAILAKLYPAASAPRLRVEVIGDLRVYRSDGDAGTLEIPLARRKARELLRLLAISGGPLSRESAIRALWPDADSTAETTLRVTIHTIRQALNAGGDQSIEYIKADAATLALERTLLDSIDAEYAQNTLRRGQFLRARGDAALAIPLLEQAATAFERAPRRDAVPDWMRPHVERWIASALDALRNLAAAHEQLGDRRAAITTLNRAIALDPLDEEATCMVLELYAKTNDTERGRAMFAKYRQQLAAELDATPGPAVMERYARLIQNAGTEASPADLSERERQVLALVSRGQSNKEIADALVLSVWTVNNHVARIFKKLGVQNRVAAAAVARRILNV